MCARHSLRHGDSAYSAYSASQFCAQWRCAATPRPGWAERDCLGSAARERTRTSVLATPCRSAGAARSGRPRAGAEQQGGEARTQGGEERRRTPERPTWSSTQCDTAQCADQGAASTPPAARMCGRSRVLERRDRSGTSRSCADVAAGLSAGNRTASWQWPLRPEGPDRPDRTTRRRTHARSRDDSLVRPFPQCCRGRTDARGDGRALVPD